MNTANIILVIIVCSQIVKAELPSLFLIWDTRRIPYMIDNSLDSDIRSVLQQAISQINQQTCITFDSKTEHDIDYLTITAGSSCETYVGKYGGEQILHLSDSCSPGALLSAGDIWHELLHTLGFYHEHQRFKPQHEPGHDRDTYITVDFNNISPTDKVNFRKKSPLASSINILEYDYESLTHYGRFTFSFNNQPTIVTKDVSKQGLIGQRNYFSSSDIRKIEMYYNCETSPILTSCNGLPPQPSHGTWRTVQGVEGDVGHMVQYACDSGYTLVGPTNRSCLLDGSWQAYAPSCMDNPQLFSNFDDDDWNDWTRTYEGENSGYWRLNKRGTGDTFTGPTNDHTTMASNGYFAYVEASETKQDDVAILTSPTIRTSSADTCIKFAYSMYGEFIGTIELFYKTGTSESRLFSESGGKGPGWKTTIKQLPLNTQLQVVFKLSMTGYSKCDMALDDILIAECSQIPS